MIDQSRLDSTTAPAKPGRLLKKPFGRGFWALVAIFLFVGPALAVIVFGQLIYNVVSADEQVQPPPPISVEESAPALPVESAPAPVPVNPDEDPVYQDEAGVWRNTNRGERPEPHFLESAPKAPTEVVEPRPTEPNLLTLGLKYLSGGPDWSNPGPTIKLAQATQADRFYQDEKGVWRNTGDGTPKPSQTEQVYQDESGVWRNFSLGNETNSTTSAPTATNPTASLLGGLLGQGGGTTAESAPVDVLSGLLGGGGSGGSDLGALMGMLGGSGQGGAGGAELGALMGMLGGSGQGGAGGADLGALMGMLGGSGQGGAGGADLGSLMGMLMGGSGQGGAGGADLGALMGMMGVSGQGGVGGAELGAIMDMFMGGAGQGGGQAGDLAGLLNGVMSSMGSSGPPQAAQVEEIAPLNITRVRPESYASQAGASQAAGITSNGGRIKIEEYERFDPAKAGEVKSEWEFFDDPR